MDCSQAVADCIAYTAKGGEYYYPYNRACEPCDKGICCTESKPWRILIPVVPFLAGITVLVLGILGHFEAINLLDTSYHLPFIYAGAAALGASLLTLLYPCILAAVSDKNSGQQGYRLF